MKSSKNVIMLLVGFVMPLLAFSAFAAEATTIAETGIIATIFSFLPASVVALIGKVVTIGTAIVTAATAIVAITPTPKDDNWLAKIRSVLSFLSGNIGYNK